MLNVIVCCTSGGSSEMTSTSVQCATTRPAIPPRTASSSDSVRSCPIKRAPARADREPDGHLSGACGRSREQQVGDVGAGDEQHERRDAKQQAERRLRLVRNRALAASARREEDGLRAKTRHRLRAHVLLQRRFDIVDDGVILRAERRARGFDRDARPQAREQVRPIVRPERPIRVGVQHRAQRDRDEHGRPHPDRRAVEALRRDADDRQASGR